MSFSVNKDIKDAKILIHHNESIDNPVTEIMCNQATGEISEAAVCAEGEEKVMFFIWMLVLASSISSLLFRYDTGVISGALVTIGSDLGLGQLSNTQKELITLATTLGMLIGGLFGSMTLDFIGCKPVLAAANIIFIGGVIGQAHSISRKIGGQVVTYGIGAAFESSQACILTCCGNLEQTTKCKAKNYAYATPEQVVEKVKILHASIQESIDIQNNTTFLQWFRSILLHLGFNTLMYYSATLFKSIGFNKPTAVSLIVARTNFLFMLVALKYIDIIGQCKIMIFTPPGMIFGLTLASISFFYLTKNTGGVLVKGSNYSKTWSGIILFSMQSELFALEVHGIGALIATAMCWAANLLIGAMYLSLMHAITPSGAFGFYAGLCLLGWLFVIFCYPETLGLSLEEVKLIFSNHFGIKTSTHLCATKHQIKERRNELGTP